MSTIKDVFAGLYKETTGDEAHGRRVSLSVKDALSSVYKEATATVADKTLAGSGISAGAVGLESSARAMVGLGAAGGTGNAPFGSVANTVKETMVSSYEDVTFTSSSTTVKEATLSSYEDVTFTSSSTRGLVAGSAVAEAVPHQPHLHSSIALLGGAARAALASSGELCIAAVHLEELKSP